MDLDDLERLARLAIEIDPTVTISADPVVILALIERLRKAEADGRVWKHSAMQCDCIAIATNGFKGFPT